MPVPRQVYLFLAVGLVAASQSGNIIRLGDAHPVAIVAFRLGLATLILAPLAGRDLVALAALRAKDLVLLVLAGMALAAHLVAWTAAVQLTTVANASTFYAVNPIITATAAWFIYGERLSRKIFASIGLGLVGVAVIGGGDLSLRPDHVPGDLLALVCSALFTVYFLIGKRLRGMLDTSVYVTGVYGVAALASFACMAVLGLPFAGYGAQTWVCFSLMAVLPTVIGHTSFNNALRHMDASRISVATLSEPLFAGTVAFFAWGERVTPNTIVGYALISGSVALLVLDAARAQRR
ncbi:MAG: DMT family transporter [Deltaproteobacteria bacterium]|nr:DMT family transporter [Deltaproteobacteria bacterium]